MKGTPPSAIGRSRTSRVVPATSVTIAASSDSNALKSEDFPAFGGPASTTRTPSRRRSASGRAATCRISPASSATFAEKSSGSAATSSSSAKSITASTAAASTRTRLRHSLIRRETAPPAACMAPRRCNSVSAESKSPSPSASARSTRPLRKARRVNSPGSASRSPGTAARVLSTAATTALPP